MVKYRATSKMLNTKKRRRWVAPRNANRVQAIVYSVAGSVNNRVASQTCAARDPLRFGPQGHSALL